MLPAYAGLISSMGLGFIMQTAYLLPFTVICLMLAVGALGFRAKGRRGYGPFVMGIVAASVLVLGKFVLASDLAVYASVAALIGSSVWNSWPMKTTTSIPSAPTESLLQIGSIEKEK